MSSKNLLFEARKLGCWASDIIKCKSFNRTVFYQVAVSSERAALLYSAVRSSRKTFGQLALEVAESEFKQHGAHRRGRSSEAVRSSSISNCPLSCLRLGSSQLPRAPLPFSSPCLILL